MYRIITAIAFWVATVHGLPAEQAEMRVLTWNIHHGEGMDRKIDLDRIAKIILKARPDLVILQEVDQMTKRCGNVDQTAELARLTGMEGVFGKAMDFNHGAYGQAVLSKHPVKSSKVHPLPSSTEPRIAFETTIAVNGTEIRLVSVHLDLDAGKRKEQAEQLHKIYQNCPQPVILGGDFNDTPDSPPMRVIGNDFQFAEKSAPVATSPADNPNEEIDHFFTKRCTATTPLQVIAESIASDHRPVSGVFRLALPAKQNADRARD